MFSFAIHVTRGLLRDQRTRRKVMFASLFAAVVLIIAGSSLLQSVLDPHKHPTWFIFFWLACAWVTTLAMLLALLDILITRIDARAARRALREARRPGDV
ncbi:MAG: hypothetical protein ABJB09_02220 [Verrucomicrobiota bacterium]